MTNVNTLPKPTKIGLQIPVTFLRRGDWIFDHSCNTWREVLEVVATLAGVVITTRTGNIGPCSPQAGATISFVEE